MGFAADCPSCQGQTTWNPCRLLALLLGRRRKGSAAWGSTEDGPTAPRSTKEGVGRAKVDEGRGRLHRGRWRKEPATRGLAEEAAGCAWDNGGVDAEGLPMRICNDVVPDRLQQRWPATSSSTVRRKRRRRTSRGRGGGRRASVGASGGGCARRRHKESLAAGTETSEVGSTTTEDIVDVTLRKPVVHQSEDDEQEPELKMKPNLDLKMRKDMDEDLSNIFLLQKPEAAKEMANALGSTLVAAGEDTNEREEGLQPSEESLTQQIDSPALDNPSVTDNNFSMQAFLQGRPRKDLPVETSPSQVDAEKKSDSDDKKGYVDDGGNVLSSTLEDITESDWTRLEHYASTGERVEVELINCSAKGFVVSLDSMIGFLPYRNLATKWKFLAFETWLRRKGGDPSLYKQSMSMEEGSEVNDRSIEPESVSEVAHQDQGTLQSRLKFEELLRTYDEEKSKFLSSFIGQRLRVSVVLADRNSKRLFFSMRPKESDELIQKRKSLMARLNVGDIVTCTIKRFVYFGIFVEVEGVPALIQQWEVSWDETLDPSVSYRIGQVVDAKVIQLDFNNSRIFLSLKDVKPSPPVGALEAVIGDEASLDGSLEPAQADFEWPEVDSLIEELKNIEQVKDVYKGRFFRSPGLAPTFQVYMASLVGQKYKVLARYGNSVQEVMVETSLDKEGLKEAIMMCTNRVS